MQSQHSVHTGVLDSSGLRFHYTATPPREEAGIIMLGHSFEPNMVVPPQVDSYIVQGLCPGSCTAKVRGSDYCIADIFRGVKFSWFSWLRGEPRKFLPAKQYHIVPG